MKCIKVTTLQSLLQFSSVVREKMLRYNNNRHKVMITAHIVITMSKEMIPLYIYDICLIEAQCLLVVHRSSETSTNQSDVIIRSDDRFLNLVVDSDCIA
jgi:hypothetical protein